MALRRLISNAILPNLEKDISRTLKREIESVSPLLDSMMQPQAYGFVNQGAAAGVYRASGFAAGQVSPVPVKKVNYAIQQVGLFH